MTKRQTLGATLTGLLLAALVVVFFVRSFGGKPPTLVQDTPDSAPPTARDAGLDQNVDAVTRQGPHRLDAGVELSAEDRLPASDPEGSGPLEPPEVVDSRTAELEAFSFRRSVMNGVEGRRYFFRRCYQPVRANAPETAEMVMLEIYARPREDDPLRAEAELISVESRNLPPEALDCFADEVERLVFPAPPQSAWDGDGGVSIRYPLVFDASGLPEIDNSVSR